MRQIPFLWLARLSSVAAKIDQFAMGSSDEHEAADNIGTPESCPRGTIFQCIVATAAAFECLKGTKGMDRAEYIFSR